MSTPKRSLKQLAQRYSGNLDYFKKSHYLREFRWRALFGIVMLALLGIALMVLWDYVSPENSRSKEIVNSFYNPGPISQAHASFAMDCTKCHQEANRLVQGNIEHSPVDSACMSCHEGYELHQPNSPRQHSCTACHHEHVTAGPMKPVNSANCASCHASETIMAEAAAKGMGIPAHAFDFTADDGMKYFKPERPAEGYTQAFHAFDDGHPAFQIHRDQLKDPNSLKFNHQVHMTGDSIPELNGQPLNCMDCHVPDASGAYMQPMTYEANCQSCHSLQFDPRNPGMEVPHGDADAVMAYLSSLSLQYEKEAKKQGMKDSREILSFVQTQMIAMKQELRNGASLEERVYFSGSEQADPLEIAGGRNARNSEYAGCIYCHDVTRSDTRVPQVTAPEIPDRWMGQSRFDHSRHKQMACTECHSVDNSELTSDILMPTIESCQKCHSQQGKVVSSCQTCHGYHAPPSSAGAEYWKELAKEMQLDTDTAK